MVLRVLQNVSLEHTPFDFLLSSKKVQDFTSKFNFVIMRTSMFVNQEALMAQAMTKKLKVPKLLKDLNRDYADSSGTIDDEFRNFRELNTDDYKVGHLNMLLKARNERFARSVNIVVDIRTFIEGDKRIYSAGILALKRWNNVAANQVLGTQEPRIIMNYRLNEGSTNAEYRRTRREMSKDVRAVLRREGFRTTTRAKIGFVVRTVRNVTAVAGGVSGAGTTLYKLAEHFVQLPKFPILP